MPLTKISAPRHLPQNQVRALAAAVQDGLVKTCNVPSNDLFQLITRFDAEEIILDPHFGGVNRSNDACVIEVVFLLGRTDDQKRALFRHVAEQATHVGFRADDVMIALVENSRMDWSLGLGVAYADHHSKA
ncbi:MAG: tautomerase family protein [Burkholderiales bacterium]|jgi:phenylpyruvate tautomerase PptA (4-oxalocrotonate tautomerase family)|nr:tautomerase family protein [Burkholderiales bacterium]